MKYNAQCQRCGVKWYLRLGEPVVKCDHGKHIGRRCNGLVLRIVKGDK